MVTREERARDEAVRTGRETSNGRASCTKPTPPQEQRSASLMAYLRTVVFVDESLGSLFVAERGDALPPFKGEQVEPATDIYSLGIMLYQLVTGKLPFTADTPMLVGMKHLNEIPPPPRSLRPDLPEPNEWSLDVEKGRPGRAWTHG